MVSSVLNLSDEKHGDMHARPRPATWTQDMKDWRSGKVTAVSLYRDKYHMSRSVFYNGNIISSTR